MKWYIQSSIIAWFVCCAMSHSALAQGNRGGARPSLGRVGASGARPMPRPQMPAARPQMPAMRPQMPTQRPQMPQVRPQMPVQRPQMPSIPTARPNLPNNRPSFGNISGPNITLPNQNRPNVNRPNINLPNVTRPNSPSIERPSKLPSFPNNIPNRPTTLPSRPSLGIGSPDNKLPTRPNIGNGVAKPLPEIVKPTRPALPTKPPIGALPPTGNNRPKPEIQRPKPPSLGGVSPRPLPELNRPGQGRPGIGGAVTLPGIITKPTGPNWGNGNWGNGNWGNNNWGNGNWWNSGNNINNNVNVNLNRPFWDRPGWNDSWHNHHWHNGWHQHCIHPHYHVWYNGCWSGYWDSSWYSPLVWGGIGWGLSSWTNSYTNMAYTNPYYSSLASTQPAFASYDYSQPIVINNYVDQTAASPANGLEPVAIASPTDAALASIDEGLAAFKSGDYATAVKSLESAIQQNGGDPVAHEVCALALFAVGDYQKSAAILNALLASAPGMDWTSMSALYGNPEDYTQQLRKLEASCRANPKNPTTAFVLAYHYLVLGEKDAAINSLKVVVANQPNDMTAKRMLEALIPKEPTQESSDQIKSEIAEPDVLPTTDLVGQWIAKAGNSTIRLSINESSQFTWKATETGKPDVSLEGELTTSANGIVLETETKGSLAGSVRPKSNDEWTFFPPGAKPEDGLTFRRSKSF